MRARREPGAKGGGEGVGAEGEGEGEGAGEGEGEGKGEDEGEGRSRLEAVGIEDVGVAVGEAREADEVGDGLGDAKQHQADHEHADEVLGAPDGVHMEARSDACT